MRYLSVCAGIEAATSAWHHLGWEPVAFSEIEPFPSAVLQHHYPTVPNWGDMTQFKTWPDATIDLLVGGTPCQSFSVAGLRKGLEDPRGNLMLTFLGIADRYRPRYIVWENVPGVLSSNGGKDFGSFLGALGELGYGWAYRVLDAQWFGVAQRRRRVFVVGCLGDQRRAAEVLFESEGVSRNTPPSRAKGQGAAADVAGSLGSRGSKSHTELDGHGAYVPHPSWWNGEDIAGTLTKMNANGAQRMPDKDNFGAILQPHAFKVRGGCEGGGKGYLGSDDTAFTVATHQDQQIYFGFDGDVPKDQTLSETISTREGGITDTAHAVAQPIPFDTTQLTSPSNYSSPKPGDPCHPLAAGAHIPAVATSMQVRRLTPVECERLQGFPDNHTNIPWRKKAEAPDGPRYKALGNSMAVPVMRWIGKRINAC
jgi:DNA (cytosine-5)-methyltransferase 1